MNQNIISIKATTASIILDNILLLDRAIEIKKYCAASYYADQICMLNTSLETDCDILD